MISSPGMYLRKLKTMRRDSDLNSKTFIYLEIQITIINNIFNNIAEKK